ncbi:MAG TPA: hypothetical protein VGO25_12150 [Rhodanobacteraceae bacterium]|nr:hypothetical protein [Rhodanobacteraceae bacterium]
MSKTNGLMTDRFQFVADWQSLDPAEGEAITEFWRREGALNDEAQMKARLPQVVMHAKEGDSVVAVCTAIPMTPPQFGQPVYYFRSFVGKNWRTTTVFKQLYKRAQVVLEEYARANDFPCIGIMIELEGARFKEKLRVPIWPQGLVYVGKSGRGLESRVSYFKGAKLKPLK